MSKIHLGRASSGEEVLIDIPSLVSTRLLVTASSGGGKSETLRRILEEAVGHIQCIVIDPEGEFSTLRERYPYVLVGEGGETPADIRTAALVATRLLELNASAVCDIYEMPVQQRHEWVKRFLDALVHVPKSLWHPVLVIVDEAHTYCPEAGYGKSVASQSIIDLCNLGRKRGFCAVLATQRLSKLDKNAVEPLQNYLVGRTTFDDQERAARTFKVPPGKATRDFSLELERLKDGQFIARGRAITGDMLKVQVMRGSTRPPKTGTAMAGVVTPTPEAVKLLLPKLADLPHEAEKKQKTEDDLKKELQEAKRRVGELERAAKSAAPNADQSRQIASHAARIEELESYSQSLAKQVDSAKKVIEKIGNLCASLAPAVFIMPKDVDLGKMDFGMPGKIMYASPPPPRTRGIVTAKTFVHQNGSSPSLAPSLASDLTGPQRRILDAMSKLRSAQVYPCPRIQVAFLSDYGNITSTGFAKGISALSSAGLVNYPTAGTVAFTAEGEKYVEASDPLESNEELHNRVVAVMAPVNAKVLRPLLNAYPDAMERQQLAEETGYTNITSTGFAKAISRLSSLGFVEYPSRGTVRASDVLFPL